MMNRHADIPPLSPSFINSTQFPIPCSNGGAGESGRRPGLPPSHRSLIPPRSPYSQIPTTPQPIGSQNFSPGSGLSGSMSQPSPVYSLPPLSPFRDSPSAPVAAYGAALPPIPVARGSGSSTLPPRKAHRRANSDVVSGLNSLMAQNSPRLIYPKPMDIPIGVESQKETKSPGEAMDEDELLVDVSDGDATENGSKKRRAGEEIAPSTRLCRSVSMDSSLDGQMLPPSPGNLNPGLFTDYEMMKIVASGKLKDLAESNPKHVKRILANRQSAARSKERKVQYMLELEKKVKTLEAQNTALSAQATHLERVKMVLENENRELRIRIQGMEEHAQLRDTMIGQMTVEVNRLKLATGQNLGESSNMQSPNANMFQQLNINQLHQPQTNPNFE